MSPIPTPEGFHCTCAGFGPDEEPLGNCAFCKKKPEGEEIEKLIYTIESQETVGDVLWKVGTDEMQIFAKLIDHIRSLRSERDGYRDALTEIDNTISGSGQWWKSITRKALNFPYQPKP